ncbi:MAG TPA: heavy-metal-associated domain-containing protein [Ilumatobacteraceae bacterium]|nr:heavy-metal-associated domain-containing protein [Ilumatobacteraceae bacterium]
MPARLASSPAVRLAAYGALLVGLLLGGAAVGAAFGPAPAAAPHTTRAGEAATNPSSPVPAGLAVSQHGFQLHLATPTIRAGRPAELQFVIAGPDQRPVTDFDVAHDKELHLVVVSRDLATFAHVHPARDAAGTWRVAAPALPAGSYRVYADFVPAGGPATTLAADLAVPGDYRPAPPPVPTRVASVDGYDVHLAGELVAGDESAVTVTVSRAGAPVTDLDPYLGALGHLVAIRDGDLAYLHVHPLDQLDGPGGPSIRFAVDVPTAGTYGFYVDFSHGGAVHSARFVAVATSGPAAAGAPTTVVPGGAAGDHGTHGG